MTVADRRGAGAPAAPDDGTPVTSADPAADVASAGLVADVASADPAADVTSARPAADVASAGAVADVSSAGPVADVAPVTPVGSVAVEPPGSDRPAPEPRGSAGAAGRLWARVPESVRATLPLWLLSRVAVALVSLAAARVVVGTRSGDLPGFLTLWNRWDVGLFTKVARYGYLSPAYSDRTEVDFPGMPFAIRVAHLVLRNWIVAGLVVSLLAGAVAVACLWRMSADEVGAGGARGSVLPLILAPYAVFFFAGYSEGLFLACSIAAWLAAGRQRWVLAGVLGAAAAATRVTGIPLCLALAVRYLMTRRRAGLPIVDVRALTLLVPPLPVIGFVAYLHARTGHWNAYTVAMREGWHRTVTWPWTGWKATWSAAFDPAQGAAFTWFWRAELAAVVLGVVLTVLLCRSRRWDEAVYVGACTLLMSASSYYASGVRTALVWFPLYLLLGRVTARWPQVGRLYAWLSGPLMVVFVVAFTQGQWVD